MESESSPFFITEIYAMPFSFARSVLTGKASKSYTLSRSAASVNEGDSVTFTLTSTGLNDESVPYNVTGITDSDITSGSLSGNIVINSDGLGSAAFNLANDLDSEGPETITFTVGAGYQQYADDNGFTTNVTVNDTSTSPTVANVGRGANYVDEGSSVHINVSVANHTSARRVYYKITGIEAADLTAVTRSNGDSDTGAVTYDSDNIATEAGYIEIDSDTGQANCILHTTADLDSEGAQTLTFTVTRIADSEGTTLKTDGTSSTTVVINDTSAGHPVGQTIFAPGSQNNPTGSGSQASNTYAASYTWTVPSGVTDVSIVAVGAGASGVFATRQSNNNRSGSGGGGGGLCAKSLRGFSPGTLYNVEVGLSRTHSSAGSGGTTKFVYAYTGNGGFNDHYDRLEARGGRGANSTNAADNTNNNTDAREGGGGYHKLANWNGGQYTSGVTEASNGYPVHTGKGGAGGKGVTHSSSGLAGGGGGGAGGWGRGTNANNISGASGNAAGTGGQGGFQGTNGNNGGNFAGGGGGGGNWRSGAGGGVGLDGPNNDGNSSGASSGVGNRSSGGQGSPWSGYEYGFGGGGTGNGNTGNQTITTSPNLGGSGAVRIKWSEGSHFDDN